MSPNLPPFPNAIRISELTLDKMITEHMHGIASRADRPIIHPEHVWHDQGRQQQEQDAGVPLGIAEGKLAVQILLLWARTRS